MKRPKIVFGMNTMFAVHQFLPEVLTSLQQKGYEVLVAAPTPGMPNSDAQEPSLTDLYPGVKFFFLPMNREISILSDILSLWHLLSILRHTRPDISNMSTPKMAFLGGLAAWFTGVPHRVYTLRGLRYETTKSWKRILLMMCEKIACACAHQVICISRSVKERASQDRIAAAEKLILLGERGSEGITISTDSKTIGEPTSLSLRSGLEIPEDAFVIGFVGRLTKDKGIVELVKCLQILKHEGRSVRLLLLGDFEQGDPVDLDTAEWIRSSPDVHWLGFVPDPSPFYHVMDVFVFPSYREGLPKVLLEAAAASTPVVASDTTGVVDIVIDGVTGILVAPGDAFALARATSILIDNRELATRMGWAARRHVEENFDNGFYLDRLAQVLDSTSDRELTVANI